MVVLLGPQSLSLTSYGYRPPPEATAHGWRCANGNCAAAGRRAQRGCRRCGSPVDPEFDEPWAHEARGVQLGWQVDNMSQHGAGLARERLLAWQLKDALLRKDGAAAAGCRAGMRDYAGRRQAADGRWNPGLLYSLGVFCALDLGDLDGAASDLCFWLAVRTHGGLSLDNGACPDDNSVMLAAVAFLDAPGGADHPRAAEIRKGCLRVAGGALRAVG